MSFAVCECKCGHVFTSRVVEDSPDINYFEIEDLNCPECDSEEFNVKDVEHEYFNDDAI